jgi:hypothetical protein
VLKKLLILIKYVEVAAVSRNRYGVEKTVDTHKILINAITSQISTFHQFFS